MGSGTSKHPELQQPNRPFDVAANQVLRFIAAYTREFGQPPSIRQIGKGVGYSGHTRVLDLLNVLEKRGYVYRDPITRRTHLVNGFAPELCNHDYRLTGDGDDDAGTLTIQCVACGHRTEVVYEGETDDPATWVLRWVGKVE